MKRRIASLLTAPLALYMSVEAAEVRLFGWRELGFRAVMDHKTQFSKDGTYFDYDKDGGQDVLFPFAPLSLEADLTERHKAVFLYQPLLVESEVLLRRSLTVDELTFPAGTPTRFVCSFPFYRISYLYDLWPEAEREPALGISLQIRNATISFASLDGGLFRSERDVGPVPALKVRAHIPLAGRWWVGGEADGMWAPIKYIDGSKTGVEGAILDAALRGD